MFDRLDRHRPDGQEAKHDPDPARNIAFAILPTLHAPRANTKQRGNTLLGEAESAECLVKFRRGHAPVSICPEST